MVGSDRGRPMFPLEIAFKPLLRGAARRALMGRPRDPRRPERGRFTRHDVDVLLASAWRRVAAQAPGGPREPTFGGRMNVFLAGVTWAFFSVLLEAGVRREHVIELIADAAWPVYARWAVLPALVARIRTEDPAERMRVAVNAFLRFPFNPPAYVFDSAPTPDGIDVTIWRCPVAEAFRARGASDLCVGTWCNLDYALSEMWGGRLARGGTLAGGASRCEFHFAAARPWPQTRASSPFRA